MFSITVTLEKEKRKRIAYPIGSNVESTFLFYTGNDRQIWWSWPIFLRWFSRWSLPHVSSSKISDAWQNVCHQSWNLAFQELNPSPRNLGGGAALPCSVEKVFRGERRAPVLDQDGFHWEPWSFNIKRNTSVLHIWLPKECFWRLTCFCRISKTWNKGTV